MRRGRRGVGFVLPVPGDRRQCTTSSRRRHRPHRWRRGHARRHDLPGPWRDRHPHRVDRLGRRHRHRRSDRGRARRRDRHRHPHVLGRRRVHRRFVCHRRCLGDHVRYAGADRARWGSRCTRPRGVDRGCEHGPERGRWRGNAGRPRHGLERRRRPDCVDRLGRRHRRGAGEHEVGRRVRRPERDPGQRPGDDDGRSGLSTLRRARRNAHLRRQRLVRRGHRGVRWIGSLRHRPGDADDHRRRGTRAGTRTRTVGALPGAVDAGAGVGDAYGAGVVDD